ncbi:DUF2158 domain-containing protein [Novosphingopyxis iocasae]|uniref:DUF2158 domain-containing protein n=1 Tax=Novosphingopyxis iocasae TaxID=2762729 RepID=UPI0016514133
MADKFQKGDVVVLKSGGVPMTISRCPSDTNDRGKPYGVYLCVWQKGATHTQHPYEEHVLEPFTKPN